MYIAASQPLGKPTRWWGN